MATKKRPMKTTKDDRLHLDALRRLALAGYADARPLTGPHGRPWTKRELLRLEPRED